MKYRLAIFDFDGTLASSLDGIRACLMDALTAYGYAVPSLNEMRATVDLTVFGPFAARRCAGAQGGGVLTTSATI